MAMTLSLSVSLEHGKLGLSNSIAQLVATCVLLFENLHGSQIVVSKAVKNIYIFIKRILRYHKEQCNLQSEFISSFFNASDGAECAFVFSCKDIIFSKH